MTDLIVAAATSIPALNASLNASSVIAPAPNALTTSLSTLTSSAAGSSQSGLLAQYFEGKDFTNLKWSEITPTVNFSWGFNAPNAIVPADNFAVRWTGQVLAKASETYTFYTQSDDGTRLWVNGQLLIDNWTDHGVTENSGAIALTGSQAYDIKLEYYDNTGGATAQLLWSSPTQTKEIVPASQLLYANAISAAPSPGLSASSNQPGLQAQYFEGKDLTNLKWSEINPTVNFNWGFNAPNSIVPADNFAVRWTGQVLARTSETYTFYTRSDDGVRLWVNGQLLIDNWTDHELIENSSTIALVAGQAYALKLEYYDKAGGATSQLLWSSPTQAKEIIPASQLFQGISTRPFAIGEPTKSARAFVDSIGINTHIRYYDTAYGNYPFIKQSLLDLGIRHIRDGGSDPTWAQRINELGSLGIKSTLVLDPNIGIGPDASYDVKPPGYTVTNFVKNIVPTGVEAVEILNEFDLFYNLFSYTRNGQPITGNAWVNYVRDFTRDVYTTLKADPATANIPIIGPSFVYSTSSSAVGDLSQWVDYGSFHPYNNPNNPGDGSLAKDYALRSQAFGKKSLIATEVGYSTGSRTSDRPVSEAVQGKYIPRLFLESFNQGVPRTFSYELIDQKADPNNSENNYGLIRSDGTPKPAYTALKNLISLLNDPLPTAAASPDTTATPATTATPVATATLSVPLGALNYSIASTPNVHHTLLEKNNGDFYLVLWLEVPSTDQPVSQAVTLNFNTPLGQATTYSPNQSIAPVAQYAAPTQLTLNVTDAPLVVKLSAPPARPTPTVPTP